MLVFVIFNVLAVLMSKRLSFFRQRSNTALWLDKKEQALKKAAKIKVIKWENPHIEYNDQERAQMFPKKDLTKVKDHVKKKSLLTEQLENCPHLPHRQYLEYAKFDGTAQLGLPTKTFKIFMTMFPEKYQNYPIIVCVIGSAKIQELIGLTCYKYRYLFYFYFKILILTRLPLVADINIIIGHILNTVNYINLNCSSPYLFFLD